MLLKQRVPVAQPDRVLGYEPRDRGFESLQARHRQSSDGSAVFLYSHGFSMKRTLRWDAAAVPCMLYFHAHSWRGCQDAWESERPRVRQIGQTRGDCALCGTPIRGALRPARREEVRIQPRVRRISKRAAVVPCVPHTSTARFTPAAPPALKRSQTIHFTRYTAPQTRR